MSDNADWPQKVPTDEAPAEGRSSDHDSADQHGEDGGAAGAREQSTASSAWKQPRKKKLSKSPQAPQR